jgi:DNA-3-methyladenine glycosylase
MPADDRRLLAGPGSLARGLGITTALTGESLLGKRVWIEDRGIEVADEAIRSGPRVGVDYAGEDALLPYRFRLNSQSN